MAYLNGPGRKRQRPKRNIIPELTWKDCENPRRIYVKKADDSTEPQIGHFSNTSLELRYYTNPLGSKVCD